MNRNNGREIAERLHLLRDYFIKHADRTHAVSMADLQRHLSNKGFIGGNGVALDKKTIYRDLDTLKMLFDMDIEYVEKYKGYVLLNPPFEDYELRLLVDGVQGSKFITQAEARKLTEKIQEHFGKGKGYSLNRPAYVSHRVRSMNDAVVKDADKLYQAIDADRMVGFQYFHMRPNRKKEYSNKGQQIIVSPYALYWNNGNLYLYAYDGRKFRYYRVDRMERIRELPLQKREGKDAFDAKNLTRQEAKVFEMYAGERYDNVKIRFLNTLADAVIDQFGRDILMIPDGDEHFSITASVEASPPFYAWVASFGRRAKILHPPALVNGMKDFLQKAADMYKDEGNI